MGTIKTFLLGMGTAYAVYAITKKRKDGRSMLDDLLEKPSFYLTKARDYAVAEAVHTVENIAK